MRSTPAGARTGTGTIGPSCRSTWCRSIAASTRGWTRRSRGSERSEEESVSGHGTLSANRGTTASFCRRRTCSAAGEAVALQAGLTLAARSTQGELFAMKGSTLVTSVRLGLVAALMFGGIAVFGPQAAQGQEKLPFSVSGTFVEGCSCSGPCPCELTGVAHGCNGVGGVAVTSGTYM